MIQMYLNLKMSLIKIKFQKLKMKYVLFSGGLNVYLSRVCMYNLISSTEYYKK